MCIRDSASGDHERPKIHIDLKVKEEEIYFSVFNSKPTAVLKDKTGYRKGIGVNNVKRQLALIYPEQHTLNINEQENSYTIALSIKREYAQ